MRYDGETVLTLFQLLQWQFPTQVIGGGFPDFRDVNAYVMRMAREFEAAHATTNWNDADFLDATNEFLLAYVKANPITWRNK